MPHAHAVLLFWPLFYELNSFGEIHSAVIIWEIIVMKLNFCQRNTPQITVQVVLFCNIYNINENARSEAINCQWFMSKLCVCVRTLFDIDNWTECTPYIYVQRCFLLRWCNLDCKTNIEEWKNVNKTHNYEIEEQLLRLGAEIIKIMERKK